MPDAHEVAVEAMAAALHDRMVSDDLWGVPLEEVDREADARAALEALVRSEAVRAALVEAPCVVLPGSVEKCGGATRGVNVRFHLPCILAALAPPEAT